MRGAPRRRCQWSLASALSDTQRDWLVKLRKEKGLLSAVRLAGPFIMSSQGKL
jgi:hypothetical protein